VNRCLTEGRQALAVRLAGIETGVECAVFVPLLSALAPRQAGYAADVSENGWRKPAATRVTDALDPPWEPDPAWHPARREAFVLYRDMPARSYPRVARELSKSTTLVKRWASEDAWQDRVRAWDGECDRRRREEFMDAGADVARTQAENAAELRGALMAPARALRTRIERLSAHDGGEPFQDLSLAELVRLTATAGRAFAQVAQVERLAHGLSTDNRGNHGGGPLVPPEVEGKSVAELEAFLTGRTAA
jgi:hypothetical protein